MKLRHALVSSLILAFTATSASAQYCINKDLINLGPTAFDIGVVLGGPQTLTWRYDGYPNLHFHSFTQTAVGGNTYLHWQNGNGNNAPIPTGFLTHIGWCTPGPHQIVDMFYTDLNGNRIPGSVVYNLTTGWIYVNGFRLRFVNRFQGNPNIVISNVRAAVFSSPFDLAELNRENQTLADQLRPVTGGESLLVRPGATAELPVPGIAAGQWIVVSYSVSGAGTRADTLDFVQFQVR